jgi:cyclophilin family peptidyl-prolyl cis-trans isomerase/HEAT repeat protein
MAIFRGPKATPTRTVRALGAPAGPRYVLSMWGRRYVLGVVLLASPALAQPALRERMLIAEDQRAATDAELAPLRQGLGSRDPATRRQAVRAIGRLERPELMPLVSRHLTDPHNDVRIEAVNAIGQLARGPEGVAAAKSRLLARIGGEKTPRVRGVVAATLGRLAYTTASDVREAERAIAALVPASDAVTNLDEVVGAVEGLEALIRQSGKLYAPASDTLARLKAVSTIEGRTQTGAPNARTLRVGVEDADTLTRIRRLARLALTAAGRIDRDLLESGVRDADDEVRRITMISARAEIEGREEVLKKGLGDAEPRVRYEALQTWGRGPQQQSCAPVLDAVRDQNPHVMLLALDLLGNGCPVGARHLSAEALAQADASPLHAIARTMGSTRDWHAPAHAFVALAKVDADAARTLLPLYVAHPVWQVRMYAADAAGTLAAIDELNALGRDAHDNVCEAALNELIVLRRPEAIQIALEALERRDYQLVITASRALAVPAANDRAAPALLAALERITADKRETSRDPRMAILMRLEEVGWPDGSAARPTNLVEALEPYVRDFDAAIARKAAAILETWTQKPVAASPQPLPLAPVKLADIDALRDARLRFVMAGKGAFELRLLVDEAPLSSLRVATRAREGYYNGLTFHRVVPNFVIQGGSPGANEYAGDGPYMRDEVGLVPHRRGTVGISTRGRDTGDAQIFVNLVDLPRLDHTYTVFAEVVSGMDVIDRVLEGDAIERVEIVR